MVSRVQHGYLRFCISPFVPAEGCEVPVSKGKKKRARQGCHVCWSLSIITTQKRNTNVSAGSSTILNESSAFVYSCSLSYWV